MTPYLELIAVQYLLVSLAVSLVMMFSTTFATELKRPEVTGCFTEWPPYTSTRKEEPYGISIDLMKAAADRAGIAVALYPLPWKRCLILVETGELDFAMDSLPREGFIQGQTPSALYTQAFWVRNDDPLNRFTGLDALSGKRLGLFKGYLYPDDILQAGFALIEWIDSELTAAKMIAANRLDLTFADVAVMQTVLSDNDIQLKMLTPVYQTQRLYPAFLPANQVIMDQMDKALAELYEDGTVDTIYQTHVQQTFQTFNQLDETFKLVDTQP